jgi:hypothetical protein
VLFEKRFHYLRVIVHCVDKLTETILSHGILQLIQILNMPIAIHKHFHYWVVKHFWILPEIFYCIRRPGESLLTCLMRGILSSRAHKRAAEATIPPSGKYATRHPIFNKIGSCFLEADESETMIVNRLQLASSLKRCKDTSDFALRATTGQGSPTYCGAN